MESKDKRAEVLFEIPDETSEKERKERSDVSPMGTEGCLWDDEYWSFCVIDEPEKG